MILSQEKKWYKVKQWDGYESWIHSFYLFNHDEIVDFEKGVSLYESHHDYAEYSHSHDEG